MEGRRVPEALPSDGGERRFARRPTGNGWVVEVPFSPSDNTVVESVLAALADAGFTGALWSKPGGQILCGTCHTTSPAGSFTVGMQRRLEGASDPADMQLVVGATCPACGAKGVLSLHYGPTAGEDDADVLVALPR